MIRQFFSSLPRAAPIILNLPRSYSTTLPNTPFPSIPPTFTFQLLSDLHLEPPASNIRFRCHLPPPLTNRYLFPFPQIAPSLFLLGDIGNTCNPEYFLFLRTQLLRYSRVFLVLGNHEPYHTSWEESVAQLNAFRGWWEREGRSTSRSNAAGGGEFILLNRTRYDLPETEAPVTILGCTLFSHIRETAIEAAEHRMDDFNMIENWNVDSHNLAFERDYSWIRDSVCSIPLDRKIILVSHHSPCVSDASIAPQNRSLGEMVFGVQSGFSTDLKEMARSERVEGEVEGATGAQPLEL